MVSAYQNSRDLASAHPRARDGLFCGTLAPLFQMLTGYSDSRFF
jgi:hypothetical protein